MKRLDPRDIFASLFVIAGGLPIAWWLGSWVYRSMNVAHLVQGMLTIAVLGLAWWARERLGDK